MKSTGLVRVRLNNSEENILYDDVNRLEFITKSDKLRASARALVEKSKRLSQRLAEMYARKRLL